MESHNKMKTLINTFARISEGDYIEVTMTTSPEKLARGEGPHYEISIKNDSKSSFRGMVDVRKSKLGWYNVNQFLDYDQGAGFSFSREKAGIMAHDCVLRIAQRISERYGVKLVDKSQEDLMIAKNKAIRGLTKSWR